MSKGAPMSRPRATKLQLRCRRKAKKVPPPRMLATLRAIAVRLLHEVTYHVVIWHGPWRDAWCTVCIMVPLWLLDGLCFITHITHSHWYHICQDQASPAYRPGDYAVCKNNFLSRTFSTDKPAWEYIKPIVRAVCTTSHSMLAITFQLPKCQMLRVFSETSGSLDFRFR